MNIQCFSDELGNTDIPGSSLLISRDWYTRQSDRYEMGMKIDQKSLKMDLPPKCLAGWHVAVILRLELTPPPAGLD